MNISAATEEDKLLKKCLAGNPKAQYCLYRKYVKAMYHTVVRIVPNPMDAEDIVQDCFVKVFTNLDSFQGQSTLGAWIKRIAINTALNFLRRNKRLVLTGEAPDELFHTQPELHLDGNADRLKQIHQAIKALPDGCRVVFTLYMLEGYRHKEIADILDISESTSKSQYLRAKKLLRQKLR